MDTGDASERVGVVDRGVVPDELEDLDSHVERPDARPTAPPVSEDSGVKFISRRRGPLSRRRLEEDEDSGPETIVSSHGTLVPRVGDRSGGDVDGDGEDRRRDGGVLVFKFLDRLPELSVRFPTSLPEIGVEY